MSTPLPWITGNFHMNDTIYSEQIMIHPNNMFWCPAELDYNQPIHIIYIIIENKIAVHQINYISKFGGYLTQRFNYTLVIPNVDILKVPDSELARILYT